MVHHRRLNGLPYQFLQNRTKQVNVAVLPTHLGVRMRESERVIDEKYVAEGWVPISNGWPDRAYVRTKDGKLEVRFVEIKSLTDTLKPGQELMHTILRSQGLDVQVEPASKASKNPVIPLERLVLMLGALEKNRTMQKTTDTPP